MKKYQIHLADSYVTIKSIPDGSVDLILTDPPSLGTPNTYYGFRHNK